MSFAGAARSIRSSVTISTSTFGLVGVTNGPPGLGRSKGTSALIHGIQRWSDSVPPARVNIQSDPVTPAVSRARNSIRTRAEAAAGRIPPSGTMSVWSRTLTLTGVSSTAASVIRMDPSRAAIVLSSRRSMPSPESLRMSMSVAISSAPVATVIAALTS
jgi:hypothetical protein